MRPRVSLGFSILGAVVLLGLAGCSCPGDVPMTPVITTSPAPPTPAYKTFAACETARTATGACPAPTAPDAACITHCTTGTWGKLCRATVTNASAMPGAACFPSAADGLYYFSCVGNATCHCY